MTDKPEICVVCAWRVACQKKYSLSGRDVRCPDFSEDISLRAAPEAATNESPEKDSRENADGGQKAS